MSIKGQTLNDSNGLSDSQHQQLPSLIQKQLQFYQQLNRSQWYFIKNQNNMQLQQHTSSHVLALKSQIVFHMGLEAIAPLFSVQAEPYIQMHQTSSQLLLDLKDHVQIYITQNRFNMDGKLYNIVEIYSRYQIQTVDRLIIVRQSVNPEQFQSQIPKNSIIINKLLDIIHLVQDSNNKDKCLFQQIMTFNKDHQERLYSKFIKEQLINQSIINYEGEDILFKLKSNQNIVSTLASSRINEQVEGNYQQEAIQHMHEQKSLISEHSRIQSQTNLQFQQIPENEYNKYMILPDRKGYIDTNLDQNHPAFKFKEMHDRTHNLSESQQSILHQFREKLSYLSLNDNTLVRFLQARNFKIPDAEKMLLNCIKWRKENNLMNRKMSDYPAIQNEEIHDMIGLDKWGHPILYTHSKNAHPEKFDKVPGISADLYLEFHQGFIEDTLKKQFRGMVDCYMVIIDCYNLTMKNFSFPVFKGQLEQVFAYYPERQFKTFIINADFLTRTIYRMVKPFLPQRTVEKLVFVGQNFEEIKEVLLKDIDLEVIPMRYGGGNAKVK